MKQRMVTRVLAVVLCVAMLATVTPIVSLASGSDDTGTAPDTLSTLTKMELNEMMVVGETIEECLMYASWNFYLDDEESAGFLGVTSTYYKTDDPTKPLSEWEELDWDMWADETVQADMTYAHTLTCSGNEMYIFDEDFKVVLGNESIELKDAQVSDDGETLSVTLCLSSVLPSVTKLQYAVNSFYGGDFYGLYYDTKHTLYGGSTVLDSYAIECVGTNGVYRSDDPKKPFADWEPVYDWNENTFEKGYAYKLELEIDLAAPFVFDEGFAVESADGVPVEFELSEDGTTVTYYADVNLTDAPASKPLTVSVETGRVPYGGEKISAMENDCTITCDAAEKDVSYMGYGSCLESSDPEIPVNEWDYCSGDTFQTGGNYAICYTVDLNSDVYNYLTVLDSATLSINGKEPDFVQVFNEGTTMVQLYVVFNNIDGLPELPYGLVVGDTIVTDDNAEDILGDGTAAYDSASNTLTLRDCRLTKGYEWQTVEHNYAGIFATGDLNLMVEGDNTVAVDNNDANVIDAIRVGGDLALYGDGNLAVTGGKADTATALYCGGEATFYVEGDYSFVSGDRGADIAEALRLYPNKVGATVTFKGGNRSALMVESDRNVGYYDFTITGEGEELTMPSYETADLQFTAVANTDYQLMVGGVTVDETNKDDIFGDGTASFNPENKTLTLNNANITTWSDFYGNDTAICAHKPLTVNLVGDNVLDMTGAGASAYWGAFIEGYWDVIVTGDGNLTFKTDALTHEFGQNGIYAAGDLDFQIGGTFTVNYGDGAESTDVYVLWADEGTLTYSAKETKITIGNVGDATVFYSYEDINIQNAGDFTASVGKTAQQTVLLDTWNGTLFIDNSGTMTLSSDATKYDNIGANISGDFILLNNGTFTMNTGDSADEDAIGVTCRELSVVSDGTFDVQCGKAVNSNGSRALEVSGKATLLCDGTVNVQAGDGYDYSSALNAEEISIGGNAKYTFTTGESSNGYTEGIYAYLTVRIGDKADVTVKVGATDGDGGTTGIYGDNVVVTDDATLNVDVASAKNGTANGLFAFWTAELSTSGNVAVTSAEGGSGSYGIWGDDVTVSGTAKGGTITVEGQSAAFGFAPRYDENGYEVLGNLNDADKLEAITADDTTACTKVQFTALKDAPDVPQDDETMLGDANGDGAVNMKDVLALRKQLAGMEIDINFANADCNGDGDINMKDVLMLRKYLVGLIPSLDA